MRAEARGAPARSPIAGGDVGALASKPIRGPQDGGVARVLRGEALDLIAREANVSVAKLTTWRERALEARRRLLRNANGMTATMKSPG